MSLQVSLLVLDDQKRNAIERIYGSLRTLANDPNLKHLPPWTIRIGSKIQIEVLCHVIDKQAEAGEILLHAERLKGYHLILLDNGWDGVATAGLKMLEEAHKKRVPHPLLVLYTSDEAYDHEFIADALEWGARGIVHKKEPNHLINLLFLALEQARLMARLTALEDTFENALVAADERLRTASPAMKQCLIKAAGFATHRNLSIVLYGETGTGKELLARAIHRASPRAARNLEVLDCTRTSADFAESILFGHERGAFTGADATRKGAFELASGGTLFIDEIQELPPDVQAKLLRVLEDGQFRRMGGMQTLSADVRIIVATSKDLSAMVEKGVFRGDLLYRLKGGVVNVPPLRERPEDLGALANYFLEEEARLEGKKITLTSAAFDKLLRHDWKGNIRELRNIIHSSVAQLSSDVLDEAAVDFGGFASGKDGGRRFARPSADLEKLLDVALPPRENTSQRKIFDLLFDRYPEGATYKELHEAVAPQEQDHTHASGNLMTIIARLNQRVKRQNFSIENDQNAQVYRLVGDA